VVKSPVTDALYTYYAHYVDPDRIFYKNNLKAGHAQITADCPAGKKICNLCERTGGNFLSQCANDVAGGAPYDAVGSMLQHFYGTLRPKNSGTPTGKIIRFSQREFARDGTGAAVPINIAMADVGYLYVPDTCARREPCRVHVAFHGCLQSAYSIKDAFYRYAGYNGWADTNHLLVLYPQVRPTAVPVLLPMNPQGCWDWWGYNDIFDSAGRYATKDGLQMAAVRRMLDRLAGQSRPAPTLGSSEGSFGAPADVVVGDFTHRQVELRWNAVQAAGYNVYRSPSAGGPYAPDQRINSKPVTTSTFVDAKLNPGTRYFYVVRAVDASDRESSSSDEVAVVTARDPPACDPYYSLDRNLSVTRDGEAATQTCS
jgi:hypothetical protein